VFVKRVLSYNCYDLTDSSMSLLPRNFMLSAAEAESPTVGSVVVPSNGEQHLFVALLRFDGAIKLLGLFWTLL
jgi:hypothetical protein